MTKRLKSAEQLAKIYECGTNNDCANYYEVMLNWFYNSCAPAESFCDGFMQMNKLSRKNFMLWLLDHKPNEWERMMFYCVASL